MIEKLTPELIALIPTVRDEWINKLQAGRKIDRAACIEGIEWLYNYCNLKKPEIVFVSSPLAAQKFLNILPPIGDDTHYGVPPNVSANVAIHEAITLRSDVKRSYWNRVSTQLLAEIRDNIRETPRNIVEDNVLYGVLSDTVEETVRNNVRKNVAEDLHYYPSTYCNISDYGWMAYCSFFERAGLGLINGAFRRFRDLINTGLYDTIQLDGLCVVSEMPTILERSPTGQLHSTTGPAIAWADGYEIYAHNGVTIGAEWPRDLINDVDNNATA